MLVGIIILLWRNEFVNEMISIWNMMKIILFVTALKWSKPNLKVHICCVTEAFRLSQSTIYKTQNIILLYFPQFHSHPEEILFLLHLMKS